MSDAKKVAFRSSISGYNREDVNRYILSINREFEEKESALQRDAEKSASNIADMTAEIEKCKCEIETLSAERDDLRVENARMEEELDALNTKAEELRIKLAALEVEDTDEDKSQKYDQISAQIGDIMISANTSADAIVAAANEHASRIISETEDEAKCIRARLSDTADELLTRISRELHTSTESCYAELMALLREMHGNTAALIHDFEKRSRDLNVKVECYQSEVGNTVQNVLKEMDGKYCVHAEK